MHFLHYWFLVIHAIGSRHCKLGNSKMLFHLPVQE